MPVGLGAGDGSKMPVWWLSPGAPQRLPSRCFTAAMSGTVNKDFMIFAYLPLEMFFGVKYIACFGELKKYTFFIHLKQLFSL